MKMDVSQFKQFQNPLLEKNDSIKEEAESLTDDSNSLISKKGQIKEEEQFDIEINDLKQHSFKESVKSTDSKKDTPLD